MGRAGRGGQCAKGNVILFLTCLSLLNLLIEICIAKLLRPLVSLQPRPLPRLSACAICVLVLLYKVLCIIFNSKNSKGNNNYLAHDVFLAIELPSPPNQSRHLAKLYSRSSNSYNIHSFPTPATASSSSLSSSASSLSATSHRHCYYHCALSQFLLSLRFSYNLQSCPANFDPDLHTHNADVGICFGLSSRLSCHSAFCCVSPCYLQRA